MEHKLTKVQAFNAVSMLLDIYYIETLSDDLGGILGSMSFLQDGGTADPAMWEVWVEFLNKILNEKKVQNQNYIDPLYAFLAIRPFLEYFFGTEDLSKEIDFFIKNVNLASENKAIDPILLKIWMRCIKDVLSVEDSRDYLKIL